MEVGSPNLPTNSAASTIATPDSTKIKNGGGGGTTPMRSEEGGIKTEVKSEVGSPFKPQLSRERMANEGSSAQNGSSPPTYLPLATNGALPQKAAIPPPTKETQQAPSKSSFRAMSSDDDEEDNLPLSEKFKKEEKTPKVEISETPSSSAGKRKSSSSATAVSKRKKVEYSSDEDDEDYGAPKKKQTKKEVKTEVRVKREKESTKVEAKRSKSKVEVKEEPSSSTSPSKRKKKVEEEVEVRRWWEEEKKDDSVKWKTLEHKGPQFAPPYVRWPKNVKFLYDHQAVELSDKAEEVASFYARMLDHEYTKKEVFNKNFFKDWKKTMTPAEKEKITDLTKCDFSKVHKYYLEESEKRKAMSKEEKLKLKEEREKEAKEYGYATMDGYKEKIGNFRIEPPGLFRGRGEHPMMGRLKKRIRPEDVIINCSKGSKVPDPPAGHKWKEVRHDNTVTWLSSWTENILGSNKYIMLNPASKIKGQKDMEKFETARRLKAFVEDIRKQYTEDFKAHEMRVRQRAVALYFIDKLALRAGNEKDTKEAADTVGCCSLRIEHIKLFDELDGVGKYVVDFDFLGKDSIRYTNQVPVEKAVYKNLKIFMKGRDPNDNLFDRLDTSSLNTHLKSLMPGLSAKVFRTYNASNTLQEQLNEGTKAKDSVHEKLLSYNRANREVAKLCNHQRAIPKSHEKSMENIGSKIEQKKAELKELKKDLKNAKSKGDKEKVQKKIDRVKEQKKKMEIQQTDREENKTIALGTSKLNYLDPRISIAWCKKHNVPVEKIFNKTQRDKFRWAIDMADADYEF